MAVAVKAFQKLLGSLTPQTLPGKTRFDFSRFAEGDRVYIKGKKAKFSKPLHVGGQIDLPDGFIAHDEIIGGRPGQIFKSSRGRPYRITFPDMDKYISSMPRKVTPVYSTYASYIVSLLDIHIAPPTSGTCHLEPLEILDAGTGHGSVTLHLARSVQAANPPVPDVPLQGTATSSSDYNANELAQEATTSDDAGEAWQAWRKSRQAIIHSVEISRIYARHAEKKVVAGFRRGLYLPHIDFHVSNVSEWVDRQMATRKYSPFLSYVFLDMPSVHQHLHKVTTAMKEDALIAVFVPSITQIGDCVREIKKSSLPLRMDKVVELGEGISNGRLWDVRLAFKKSRDPIDEPGANQAAEEAEPLQQEAESQGHNIQISSEEKEENRMDPLYKGAKEGTLDEAPVMVCRPKVGEMVIGGGFVGLWRRTRPD